MQCPRNRRGGHGQHIDILFQLFDLFLMGHTETLFFVDDQQTEIMVDHPFVKEHMGADDDIRFAGSEVVDDAVDFFFRFKAAQNADAHTKPLQPFTEGAFMLLRKDRGGDQYRHLLAVENGFESRPQRHFGLAVAHITAEQAIHGTEPFHIGFDIADRLELIRRFLIGEPRFHFLLPFAVRREGVALFFFTLGVEAEQFLGHFPYGTPHLFFGVLPLLTTQTVDFGGVIAVADVFLKQIHLIRRDIQFIASLVADHEVVPFHAVDAEAFHAQVLTDAVGLVNHIIAGFQIHKGGDGFSLFLSAGRGRRRRPAAQISFGDKIGRSPIGFQTLFQRKRYDTAIFQLPGGNQSFHFFPAGFIGGAEKYRAFFRQILDFIAPFFRKTAERKFP